MKGKYLWAVGLLFGAVVLVPLIGREQVIRQEGSEGSERIKPAVEGSSGSPESSPADSAAVKPAGVGNQPSEAEESSTPSSPEVTVQTPHYTLVSSVNSAYTTELAAALENLYRTVSQRFTLPVTPENPMKVLVFKDRVSLHQYILKNYEEEVGEPTLVESSDSAQNHLLLYKQEMPESLLRTLRLATAQILSSRFSGIPEWLKAGLSLYFANQSLRVRESGRKIGEEAAENILTRFISNPNSFRLTPEEIMKIRLKDLRSRGELYIPALAVFTNFLMDEKNRNYLENLLRVRENASVPAGLDQDYRAYTNTLTDRLKLVDEGVGAYRKKEYEKSRRLLKEAYERNSNRFSLFYYLSLGALKEKDFDAARLWINRSKGSLNDRPAYRYYMLGILDRQAGHPKEAEAYFRKAAQADPLTFSERVKGFLR